MIMTKSPAAELWYHSDHVDPLVYRQNHSQRIGIWWEGHWNVMFAQFQKVPLWEIQTPEVNSGWWDFYGLKCDVAKNERENKCY